MSVVLIRASSNLGLRPLRPCREPGTWCAPEALSGARLLDAVRPARAVDLPRPRYSPEPQAGTRLRNGPVMRFFSLESADAVEASAREGDFPLVVVGDCSVLTFAKGASLPDPAGLFNASLGAGTTRAIDIREGEEVDAEALKALVRAAVALNLPRRDGAGGREA